MTKKKNDVEPSSSEETPMEPTDLPTDHELEAAPENDPLTKLEEEKTQLKDQLLRMAADFDNFRKRTRKELDDVRKYGIENLLNDILGVVDNLDRALSHANDDKSPMVQGLRMVQKQFADVLSRYGVQSFTSTGQKFDPERHEAVGQAPASADKAGTVLEEMQKGYMLHERLLRPARVVVAVGPSASLDEGASAETSN